MNPFETNTFSKYAPKKLGDTVKEQALLAKTEAGRYNTTKANFETKQEQLLSLQTAPGGEYWLNNFNKLYADEFDKAKAEGNFEDMVGDTQKLVKRGYDEFNLRSVIRDRKASEAFNEGLAEGDLSQDFVDFQKGQEVRNNPGVAIDEEGNETYVPYQAPRELTQTETAVELNTITSGFKADGTFKRNENGTFVVGKDIPGYDYIKKGTTVTNEDIKRFSLDFMKNEPNINRSIQDSAYVAVTKTLNNKGGFTKEDAMGLVGADNPYQRGTPQFKAYEDYYSNNFDAILEGRAKKAVDGGFPFDETAETIEIGKLLKDDSLRQGFAGTNANKFGFVDETLQTFKRDALTTGAETEISPFNTGIFTNPTVGTSNTLVHFGKVNEVKTELNSALGLAQKEYDDIKDSGDGNEILIAERKATVEALSKKVEGNNLISETTSRGVFNMLKGRGSFGEQKNLLSGDNRPSIENYEDFRESSFDRYNNFLDGGRPATPNLSGFALSPKEKTYQGLYQEMNPSATFENKEQRLSKDQYYDLLDKEISTKSGDTSHKSTLLNNFGFGIGSAMSKLEKEGKGNLLHQNYQMYEINLADTTQKQRLPFQEYEQVMSSLEDFMLTDIDNFSTIEGTPLGEATKGYGLTKDNTEINIMTSPINGELVTRFAHKYKIGGVDQEFVALVPLESGNNNSKVMKNRVRQAMTGLQQNLINNFDTLKTDKKEMLLATNNVLNVLDGSLERFNQLPLYTAAEGQLFNMEIAEAEYQFVPYKLGKNENNNRTLVIRENTYGSVADASNREKSKTWGRGILGYHESDLDENEKPIVDKDGKARQPRYYLWNSNAQKSPFHLKESESGEDRVAGFADWFKPADLGSPTKTFERASLFEAIGRGTGDKGALNTETIYQDYGWYENSFSNGATVDTKTSKLANAVGGYSTDNNYYPLNEIIPSAQISTNVELPFVSLNTEGRNKISALFSDFSKEGKTLMVTGGGRDVNNIVEDGAEKSKHKEFGALDLLKNPAAMSMLELWNTDKDKAREYGIVNVLGNYNDHIHIEFNSDYYLTPTEVNKL
tara:strand:+ start:9700 stop:12879 length:3180 start_codon:yes stop_codon:yes gene_type:complete